jgi:hypothetical protein
VKESMAEDAPDMLKQELIRFTQMMNLKQKFSMIYATPKGDQTG